MLPARPAAPLRRPHADGAATRAKKPRGTGPATLFVLDTNVLMHDPTSLFRFEEHDIYLPMITLEELDGHKRGMTEVARNARQVSRDLDALAANMPSRDASGLSDGLPLQPAPATARPAASCSSRPTWSTSTCRPGCRTARPTTRSSASCKALREQQQGRDVVLVSKDINMRIKARALGLPAEDYFNDKTLEDGDLLYTGVLPLPADFWDAHGKTMESWQQGGLTYYRINGPLVPVLLVNQFVYLEAPRRRAALRQGHRDHRQDRGAAHA